MKSVKALLLALALLAPAALLSEPPSRPYVLVSSVISADDGISGARVGVLAGARVPVSSSVGLLMEASLTHTPKIDAGDGYTISGRLGLGLHRDAWFGSLSASYALLTTSAYTKEAWSPRLEIGRQAGAATWLSAVWSGPDSTQNRARSLGLALEWHRRCRVLRVSLSWVGHRGGGGLEIGLAIGWRIQCLRTAMMTG